MKRIHNIHFHIHTYIYIYTNIRTYVHTFLHWYNLHYITLHYITFYYITLHILHLWHTYIHNIRTNCTARKDSINLLECEEEKKVHNPKLVIVRSDMFCEGVYNILTIVQIWSVTNTCIHIDYITYIYIYKIISTYIYIHTMCMQKTHACISIIHLVWTYTLGCIKPSLLWHVV